MPDGFYYVGGDIETGIVISDKEGDTMDATGVNMGNQFVWIPVSSEADLTRTNSSDSDYAEPYESGYSGEDTEHNTMKQQVLKYKGFYIGRFEAGVESTTLRDNPTTAQKVVCKRGVAPYNYVPWGAAMNDIGSEGAVYLAKNFATEQNYSSVKSTLCYGCQWDAMCRYIGDSGRTTDAKDAPELTGSVSTDVSKNIYDLAGNCVEWTMEALVAYDRVLRGGLYSYVSPVSDRGYVNPGSYSGSYSFRPTLYIM